MHPRKSPEHPPGSAQPRADPLSNFHGPLSTFSGPLRKFNGPLSKFKGPLIQFHGPLTQFHAPPGKLNGPVTGFAGPILPFLRSVATGQEGPITAEILADVVTATPRSVNAEMLQRFETWGRDMATA